MHKTKSSNLNPRQTVILNEHVNLKNIIPIYLNPEFIFGNFQIITNACFSAQFNPKKKILTPAKFQYLTFQSHPRGQGCVKNQIVTLHVGLHFFHFNLICSMTTFTNEKMFDLLTPPQVGFALNLPILRQGQ